MLRFWIVACCLVVVGGGVAALEEGTPAPPRDPGARMRVQHEALAALARLDGRWRGTATVTDPTGAKHTVTQTERVGAMLDGTVRVIEGRGYAADGSLSFNALAIMSYDLEEDALRMRSYAMGRQGDYDVEVTENGFSWEIPAGPMTIRYKATIVDGVWHEVGHRVMEGQDSVAFFEMTLRRLGDSDWPGAGIVGRE